MRKNVRLKFAVKFLGGGLFSLIAFTSVVCALPIGSLGCGVAARENATGKGYVLFSSANLTDRLLLASDQANQFIAVYYQNNNWYYYKNEESVAFTPQPTDILVAEVNFTSDTVVLLSGENKMIHGIQAGYAGGDLDVIANQWDGAPHPGRFTATGTDLVLHQRVPRISVTATGVNLEWFGYGARTYYVQYSSDLKSWSYMPVMESGKNSQINCHFPMEGCQLFLRLRYTDNPTDDPQQMDSDGDAVSDWNEVKSLGTDPFLVDSDGNGISDADEDRDGDGTSDADELASGTDFTNAYEGGKEDLSVDTDEDGLVNGVDAVHDDAEINWHKTPSPSYIWIEFPSEDSSGSSPLAVNKLGQVLYPCGLRNLGASDWVSLQAQGHLNVTQYSNEVVLTAARGRYTAINDVGDIAGLSEYSDIVYSAGMIWKRSSTSLDQYNMPLYFLKTITITAPEDGVWGIGGIANDGTVQCQNHGLCLFDSAGTGQTFKVSILDEVLGFEEVRYTPGSSLDQLKGLV